MYKYFQQIMPISILLYNRILVKNNHKPRITGIMDITPIA